MKLGVTLSKRQASRAVRVESVLSATKLVEWTANDIKTSAAALRVIQSAHPRHSWMLFSNDSKLCGAIAPICKNFIAQYTVYKAYNSSYRTTTSDGSINKMKLKIQEMNLRLRRKQEMRFNHIAQTCDKLPTRGKREPLVM